MKKGKWFLALVCVLAALVGLGYIALYGVNEAGDGSLNSVDLGLDLAGGVSITYGIVGEEEPSSTDVSDTIVKLQRRLEDYSTEAQVYREGSTRLTVEIPGKSDAGEVLRELGQPGNLYFLREKDSDGNANYTALGVDENGDVVYLMSKDIEELKADGAVVLEGSDIAGASAGSRQNQNGKTEFVVKLTLNAEGTQKFADATKEALALGESIGIYYDGDIISAPHVENVITDGNAIITGSFTVERAENLATIIRIGGLRLQLEELRSNVVGAQLGQDAIQSGLKAAVYGFAVIILFMLIVYLILGLSASLALGFYASLMIILLDGLEITLTLPGIAGIILSIGMAVDANVLVFSRIREEMAGGKNVRDAMTSGYKRALSAILDGNITTMIAAVVLMLLGSGPVKGFAYTLALGIVLSMITALFITRVISVILYNLGFSAEKIYGKSRKMKLLPVVEKRKIAYGISIVLICAGIAGMVMNGTSGKGAMNFSLDFVGGTSTTVAFNENWTLEELDKEILPKIREIAGVSTVQTQTVAGSNEVIFKTITLDAGQRADIGKMLQEDYEVAADSITTESISATISKEMTSSAIRAILIALVLILIYIRIRFKDIRFGISAVICLLHDALIVVTCYVLTRIEVGSTFVAVVLTIIGYSINDTIVTFDRLRENRRNAASRENLEELIDKSVTQTLTRSLFTSITTFIMVLALFIFGVNDIRNFALPLMAGVISGTFSSIFIASPLWRDLRKATSKEKK
ncbi:MAG: protein translocase subunit SecD [Lachnospiraceae bacterium]|nr:protein translocase subunit SecD [Lachnospiraceae bacterium]